VETTAMEELQEQLAQLEMEIAAYERALAHSRRRLFAVLRTWLSASCIDKPNVASAVRALDAPAGTEAAATIDRLLAKAQAGWPDFTNDDERDLNWYLDCCVAQAERELQTPTEH
jgi:hypothetical protein